MFPENRALPVFLAMACFNLGDHEEAMQLLLTVISKIQTDDSLNHYSRAIGFYADKLKQVWT